LVQKIEINGCDDPWRWPFITPLTAKVVTNVTEKQWLIGWYSLLAD
jgi:hypothetical protein